MKLLSDGVKRLLAVGDDLEAIQRVYQEKLSQMGLAHFLYAEAPCAIPSINHGTVPFFLSCPETLQESYLDAVSLTGDPVILELPNRVAPFTVAEAVGIHVPAESRGRVLNRLDKAGLGNGLVVPLNARQGRHCSSTVFAAKRGREGTAVLAEATHRVHVLTTYFHQRVRQVLDQRPSARPNLLTPRERECLLWAAGGKTAWETSRILKIAERTVKFHLANASRRLDTANTAHAVARAILRGEFVP